MIVRKKIIVNTFKPYLKIFYKYSYSRDQLLKRYCIKIIKRGNKKLFSIKILCLVGDLYL